MSASDILQDFSADIISLVEESVRAKLRVMVKRIGIFVTTMTALLVVGVRSRRPGP